MSDDGLTEVAPARARFADLADLLKLPGDVDATERPRKGESVGWPIGSPKAVVTYDRDFSRLHSLRAVS